MLDGFGGRLAPRGWRWRRGRNADRAREDAPDPSSGQAPEYRHGAGRGPGQGGGPGRGRGLGRGLGRGTGAGLGHGHPSFEGRALADIEPGERCRVFALHGRGAIRHRLMDLGLVPNAVVEVVRRAPLADPIEIRLEDAFITLRRTEAARVEVVKV